MGDIATVTLPRNEKGNDPNDFRDDSSYMKKLSKQELDSSQAVTPANPDNEDDLGLVFTARYKDELRYVANWGKWMQWDGRLWTKDEVSSVFNLIRSTCRECCSDSSDMRKRMLTAQTVSAVERLVRSDPQHATTVVQWDSNDWLLNTPTCMIDLATGQSSPHDPYGYCTKITSVGPHGDCPTFMQFLNDVTDSDQDLIRFIQRVMGYACTGSTKEHAMFFFYGTGGNGKGTLLNTVVSILNDYAVTAPMNVFTESKHESHPTELAALMGARLVVAQETDEGRKWAEAKIKTLTGGDSISARFMRQDFFTFTPKFTLIIAGNHKPSLQTVDEAMRRRLHLIPFNVTIPKEKRDPDLAEKLRKESGGIMQWMLEGCLQYQLQGLNPPQSVFEATESYFEDENMLQQWITDNCEISPEYWETPTVLFNSWKTYASTSNFSPGNNKDFKSKLEAIGIRQSRTGQRGRHYKGIKIKPDINANYEGEPWQR